MSDPSRSAGLRTIFSFFLGLMFTAFAGVGVYTFYPPPGDLDQQTRELNRREQEIRNARPDDQLTAQDRAEIQELTRRRNELQDAAEEAARPWGRSTSIILMVVATLAMAVSLVRADQLPVISNGLLLGGVFTMLYGVGWIIATDTSVARFVVMSAALAITLGLGYVRFVRRGKATPSADGAAIPAQEGLADLHRRLVELEERMNRAAEALRHGSGRSDES